MSRPRRLQAAAPVLLYKPGTLNAEGIAALTSAGYVVVPAADFDCIKVVEPTLTASSRQMFKAAMVAIRDADSSTGPRTRFGAAMAKVLAEQP